MFINVDGFTGKQNAIVVEFRRENLDRLKRIIPHVYMKEFRQEIPDGFHDIKTVKNLKEFVKDEMYDMDTYPCGFKYIDGVFSFYECIC